MKKVWLALVIIFAGILGFAGIFYYRNLRGIKPAITLPPVNIADTLPSSVTSSAPREPVSFPIHLPQGFEISIFAKNLPGARVMQFVPQGAGGLLLVSQPSKGQISTLEIEGGKVARQQASIRGLRRPHGLAVLRSDEGLWLYVAEEHAISRAPLYSAGDIELKKIVDLPSGGNHFTRTIGFGPDGRLYASIGSSCNVCNERDEHRAKIYSMNKDGSDFKEYARGLRNAVFFTWDSTGSMLATEMGRDLLGDDAPPDEINIIEQGKNYGWPICYGKNIHDGNFDKNTYIRNPCMEPLETESFVDLPAHSAPLGLAFVPLNSGWPKEYQGNLLVAYHGSWNRSVPTGYKVVQLKFDANGKYLGAEDFITGWLTKDNKALGRPVDLKFGPDGALYISDDKAGVIYRVNNEIN